MQIWETAARPDRLAVVSVDHKEIGLRYIVTAFAFLILGGLEALVMRLQLAGPDKTLLTPEHYDQLFTMHGVTMIFLYASPILSGFSNYLWPLLLGSRDMAFPRLNALLLLGLPRRRLVHVRRLRRRPRVPTTAGSTTFPTPRVAYTPGLNIDVYALG